MSAWMVPKKHVDYMVTLARCGPADAVPVNPMTVWQGHRLCMDMTDDELGQVLTDECLASIRDRYPDTIDNPDATPGPTDHYWAVPYVAERTRQLSIGEALKLLACYEYQSCEHPGWPESKAHELCRNLEGALIRRVPGYDEAPWGFDD